MRALRILFRIGRSLAVVVGFMCVLLPTAVYHVSYPSWTSGSVLFVVGGLALVFGTLLLTLIWTDTDAYRP